MKFKTLTRSRVFRKHQVKKTRIDYEKNDDHDNCPTPDPLRTCRGKNPFIFAPGNPT
jgi:hypothetical protein